MPIIQRPINEIEIFVEHDPDRVVLRCPLCKSENSIVEEDIAIRWCHLDDASVKDGKVTLIWDTSGTGDYDHEKWLCQDCMQEVDMPEDVVIDYD